MPKKQSFARLTPQQLGSFVCRINVEQMLAERKSHTESSATERLLLLGRATALTDVAVWLDLAIQGGLVGYPPELAELAEFLVRTDIDAD